MFPCISPIKKFYATMAFACFLFCFFGVFMIVFAEMSLANGEPEKVLDYGLTVVTLYCFMYVAVQQALTSQLEAGSKVYTEFLPANIRTTTVSFLTKFATGFSWGTFGIYIAISVLMEPDMKSIVLRRGPIAQVAAYIACMDPCLDLIGTTSKTHWLHHIALLAFALCVFELTDFDAGFLVMTVQNALDRFFWAFIFVSRMSSYKIKGEAEEEKVTKECVEATTMLHIATSSSSSSVATPSADEGNPLSTDDATTEEVDHGSQTAALVTDLMWRLAKKGPTNTRSANYGDAPLDKLWPNSMEKFRLGYTIAFPSYILVRVIADAMTTIYLVSHWGEIKHYWKGLLMLCMFVFIVVDINVYRIFYRRSYFGKKIKSVQPQQPQQKSTVVEAAPAHITVITTTAAENDDDDCDHHEFLSPTAPTVMNSEPFEGDYTLNGSSLFGGGDGNNDEEEAASLSVSTVMVSGSE